MTDASTGTLAKVCVESTSLPATDRIELETVALPPATHGLLVQEAPFSVVPEKSSANPVPSWTSPPEVLVTLVPF